VRRSLLLPTTALAATLALGCADQQSPTAPADLPAPSLRAEREPASAGFVLGADVTTSLALQFGFVAGWTAEGLCNTPPPEGIDPTGQKGQTILTPPGGFHANVSGRDVNLVVYQFGGGIITDLCQLVGVPVVGTGTGNFSVVQQGTSAGGVIFAITVHGTIDLASGGQARLFATAHVVVRPDGTLLFDRERVRLTPL
jgi:hypothetical protein